MSLLIAFLVSYVIGAVPTAYLVGRWRKGVDIREVGSRNMGAMNVLYSVGVVEGLGVLTLDFAKGFLAVFIARWLGESLSIQMVCGAVAILGHIYPVFLRFKGGKGGATAIGVCFALMPWGIPVFYAIFILLTLVSRFMTLAYSVALCCFPFVGWLIYDSLSFTLYASGLLIFLGFRYLSRARDIYQRAGGWRRAILRRDLKDRL